MEAPTNPVAPVTRTVPPGLTFGGPVRRPAGPFVAVRTGPSPRMGVREDGSSHASGTRIPVPPEV
jgi:hypothetical protein